MEHASESTVKQRAWLPRRKWGILLLALVVAVVAVSIVKIGTNQKKQSWIRDAEAVAIAYLQNPANRPVPHPKMPPEFHPPKYGSFQQLSGEGYSGAVWNIQGYEYLSADRLAHFENGDAEVRLLVTEGRITNPGSQNVEVLDIHWQPGAYTIPNGWRATFTISHPELR